MEESDKKYKDIELRSEEVQEVMNQISPWILRLGITVLFGIVAALFAGSYLFKYPDAIRAEITITAERPPVNITARATGKIDRIYAENDTAVSAGALLAVIENPAETEDVLFLSAFVTTLQKNGYTGIRMAGIDSVLDLKPLSLGALQPTYTALLNRLNDCKNNREAAYYTRKIALQEQLLAGQKEYYQTVLGQHPTVQEQFKVSQSVFRRDSLLHVKGLVSDEDYDVSKKAYLQDRQSYLSFDASLQQLELQIVQREEALFDLRHQALEQESRYVLSLTTAAEELDAQLKSWEYNYLLKSPTDGIVNRMGVWSSNQNVTAGETVFTVIPRGQSDLRGKAMLPARGAGKAKPGQRVNVRVNNFPDQEFGYLSGRVASISGVPNAEGFYIAEIVFPDGLKTNYGKILPAAGQTTGTAEIITEDLRLLERLLMPLKKMWKE